MSWRAPRPAVVPERLLSATRGGLGLWLDATRWWTGAVADSAETWREETERNLRQVTGLLVRAFGERQVEVECGGWPVEATLESIQLYEGGRDGARLSFRDVRWNGLLVGRLTVEAEQAAITPPPTMTLNLSAITLRGRVAFPELVAWLDGRVARWQLRATPDRLIEATFHNGWWRVTFEPALLGGEVQLALREVSWRSLRVRVPARFRVVRTVQLPDLPAGVSVSEAARDDADVEFLLEVPPISRRLDLRESLARVLASAGEGRAAASRLAEPSPSASGPRERLAAYDRSEETGR